MNIPFYKWILPCDPLSGSFSQRDRENFYYSHNRNFGPKLLFPRPPSFFRHKPLFHPLCLKEGQSIPFHVLIL